MKSATKKLIPLMPSRVMRNNIIIDITPSQQRQIKKGKLTIDELFNKYDKSI